jgi:hypothetical protein
MFEHNRFLDDFMFERTQAAFESLRSHFATSKNYSSSQTIRNKRFFGIRVITCHAGCNIARWQQMAKAHLSIAVGGDKNHKERK